MSRFSRMLALILALCMVVGVIPTTAFAAENRLNYVSIGDSMANGYGFVGYNQNSNDRNVYDLMTGKGMYGEGAYPLQFEAYLTGLGYDVNHTKLATSATLAEDLLYLLGGREEFDDGWNGYKDYVGTYSDSELMPYFQKAITEADVISMGIGNAAFGAYLTHRITDALGLFGASLDEDEKVNFEDAIAVIEMDAEQYAMIMEIYGKVESELMGQVSPEIAEAYNLDEIVDLLAYTAASFVVNYRLLLEQILEMNPDVEIVLVGMLNTTSGMNITDENGEVILAFGDVMDMIFDALNAYVAGMPVYLQGKGIAPEAKLYFAAQPTPKYICQVFEELLDNGWSDIQSGRLSGTTIRQRNIDAFNGDLANLIGPALNGGNALPRISLDDVIAYEALDWETLESTYGAVGYTPWLAFLYSGYMGSNGSVPTEAEIAAASGKILAVAIYLAIEEAVARNTNTMNISVAGLKTIANDISSVYAAMGTPDITAPETVRQWLYNGFQSNEITKGMCKIYGLFKVGNGMSVHPTPEGHDEIAQSVISAYKNNTAQDQTMANVKELLQAYGPDVAAYILKLWAERETNGLGNQRLEYSTLDQESTYVALGDGTAAPKGYVEKLAAQLAEKRGIQGYTNYAKTGNTVAGELEKIASYSAIADADLITIGFGNVTLLSNAFEDAMYGEGVTYDWAGLLGEDKVPYVQELLAEVYAKTDAMGMDEEITTMINTVIEGVAYGAAEYALKLPDLITAIREVNAEADIVIVGQYNPMDGVVLKFGDATLDFANYINYFVEGIALHGTAYCAISREAIFVEAPAVSISNADMEWTIADLAKMLMKGFSSLYPSQEGHTYIAGEILDALNLDAPVPVEPEYVLGDANGDGKVNLKDAILVLKAINGGAAVDAVSSDVNKDNKVNLKDAILILKFVNGTPFPTEK